ncbi:MAG: hypothetical protein ACE5J7_03635 [Candidatus Aenigmatarchaeota archaeon]
MEDFPVEERPWSRWNGTWKQYTKDCEDCDFYKQVDGEDRCYQGKAWKRLSRNVKKLRKCQYSQPKNSW